MRIWVHNTEFIHIISVVDPGCLCRTRYLSFSIPDPGHKDPRYRSLSKNFLYPTKTVSKLSEKLSWMFIPDPGFFSRGQKSTGSWIRIRNTAHSFKLQQQRKDGNKLLPGTWCAGCPCWSLLRPPGPPSAACPP
jgi:hypothetical protein